MAHPVLEAPVTAAVCWGFKGDGVSEQLGQDAAQNPFTAEPGVTGLECHLRILCEAQRGNKSIPQQGK